MNSIGTKQEPTKLISNAKESYGEHFEEHLLEQYKLYVDSSQKASEKRITTGNYLLAVNSSLLTVFGIAAMLHAVAPWLVVIPVAGLVVCYAWFSLVVSYKNLNTAKFRVIHELEDYLPAALFRYEWHCCETGNGKTYKPVTHHERWIPLIFAVMYLALAASILLPRYLGVKSTGPKASAGGSLGVMEEQQGATPSRERKSPPPPPPCGDIAVRNR